MRDLPTVIGDMARGHREFLITSADWAVIDGKSSSSLIL